NKINSYLPDATIRDLNKVNDAIEAFRLINQCRRATEAKEIADRYINRKPIPEDTILVAHNIEPVKIDLEQFNRQRFGLVEPTTIPEVPIEDPPVATETIELDTTPEENTWKYSFDFCQYYFNDRDLPDPSEEFKGSSLERNIPLFLQLYNDSFNKLQNGEDDNSSAREYIFDWLVKELKTLDKDESRKYCSKLFEILQIWQKS
ncbi:MAG: hypothetical protein ACRC11_15315, partial [Xenococcaceae cyanobacterium]